MEGESFQEGGGGGGLGGGGGGGRMGEFLTDGGESSHPPSGVKPCIYIYIYIYIYI